MGVGGQKSAHVPNGSGDICTALGEHVRQQLLHVFVFVCGTVRRRGECLHFAGKSFTVNCF